MSSKFQAIFNISVAGGVLGLALTDSISGGSGGGIGFVIGGVSTFVFFSLLASIADVVKALSKVEVIETAGAAVDTVSLRQQQPAQSTQSRRISAQKEQQSNGWEDA